jgi:uncharacterized membrane protein
MRHRYTTLKLRRTAPRASTSPVQGEYRQRVHARLSTRYARALISVAALAARFARQRGIPCVAGTRLLVGTRLFAVVVLLAAASALTAEPAKADFRLCNNTSNRVGIAVGYKENEGWTTEGWWNIAARSCETVLRGGLVARFYYIYAVDYDRGGEWSGQAFMCTREKEFTIRGTDDCLARGYDRTGFFEVDTGDQPSWTVQLTESADQAPMQPLQSRVPMLQTPPTAGRPGTPTPPSRSRN